MDLQLEGKRAFISGSTQGIGYAVAATLASEGTHVVLNGRNSQRLVEAVTRLREDCPGAHVSGITADLSEPEQVSELLEQLGEVDILINNVGVFGLADFTTLSDAQWQQYVDINLMSGVRLSRQLLPGMVTRGWGRIIFISSESGVNIPADMIHYGTTKSAMLALGNGLAKLTRGTEVTVNTVLGGPTYSEGVASAVSALAMAQQVPAEEIKQSVIAQNTTTLLERFIEPREIADLVAFTCSPRASATNGATLRADGGTLTSIL
ncbi:SDR family oxidoreductase [Glutamicibacter sp. PS]|uniref:SDR family NAD(P)-dependent oxidoreductase n=1 Tax=Glutamicibacter sp. PS TaxID=3075634 RepID=UPI00284AA738|nr:SDR family oxidoreductase [Glutamicibacter sp. PS]MDR4533082.1 SDR family oxidoreductase [Glutamicibacter sp. PS]